MSMLLILAGSLLVNVAMLSATGRTAAGTNIRHSISVLSPALLAAAISEHILQRWVLPTWEEPYLRAPLMVFLVTAYVVVSMFSVAAIARQLTSERWRVHSIRAWLSDPWVSDASASGAYVSSAFPARTPLSPAAVWLLSNAALLGVAWAHLEVAAEFLPRMLAALTLAAAFIGATFVCQPLSARLGGRHVPLAFRGLPIALTTAGLAVLALMAVTGLR